MSKLRTLLLDDHQIFLDGLSQLLNQLKTVDVIYKTSDPIKALQLIKMGNIELVITDLSMPIMDGNSFISELKKEAPTCKILVLSMHMDVPTIRKTIYQEVDGYLFKDSDFNQLSDAVMALMNNKKFFDTRVSQALISSLNEPSVAVPEERLIDSLTEREREILVLLSQEMTQLEIADRLNLSMSTVVYHKRKLMSLFDVKSTAGLIRFATQNGLAN